ncbi:hypothetical protein CHLNCDRAFT_22249 [Chlorella variabilis]|uniref:Uncharacterized protein n=1 Tax=Chlorella variabilis TaxID=554065 RepID=E1ZDD5_CHLVA|nr:hypothetical protein CHLNCDRAFT_22249 [Chlorella variabilis]EFN56395.1 hypothetical protein CHLNCDRAFT_22249 [Chlorella variabilis]|eukprot:XP_005848497.1 hypothetical protein CHLNCDRAFT_22249 [Chlorella variabilis]
MAAAAAADPNTLVRTGMTKFRENNVEGSVADFDAAMAAGPSIRPYLWQRGLSLYYLRQFEEGAKQFRDDVAVNPNDTEESIWAFLCEAQLLGPDQARQQFLEATVGRDSRPVMRAAYECFRTGAQPDSILQASPRRPSAWPQAARGDQQGHDAFYALLYVGLWHEAHGDAAAAQQAITQAAQTAYAKGSGDYMAALARVHCLRRGWQA